MIGLEALIGGVGVVVFTLVFMAGIVALGRAEEGSGAGGEMRGAAVKSAAPASSRGEGTWNG